MSNQPPTDDELTAIRARAEAATDGLIDWVGDGGPNEGFNIYVGASPDRVKWEWFGRVNNADDAVLFTHARRDVLTLLDEVERLRKENAELEAANKRMWRIHEWQDAAGIIGGKRK